MKNCSYHRCKDQPNAVKVRESYITGGSWGWVIGYKDDSYNKDSDNEIWSKMVVNIPIKICPWCGKQLEVADDE